MTITVNPAIGGRNQGITTTNINTMYREQITKDLGKARKDRKKPTQSGNKLIAKDQIVENGGSVEKGFGIAVNQIWQMVDKTPQVG